jgi:hypothetical protein
MCCQDGDPAIRQMLYETAGWSAEAESSFFMLLPFEEPPTAAARLTILLVPIQDSVTVRGTLPPGQPGAVA